MVLIREELDTNRIRHDAKFGAIVRVLGGFGALFGTGPLSCFLFRTPESFFNSIQDELSF